MMKEDVDKWYHAEVMNNRDIYPNLHNIEMLKMRYNWDQKRRENNRHWVRT